MFRRDFVAGLSVLAATLPAVSLPGLALAQDAMPDTSTIKDMSLGDPNAPIKVIEYASFTCPHCATFHSTVFKQLKENYIDTGKVYFTHREVYFDRYGLWAGMVARCGGEMRYFGVADMVYSGMREWTKGDPAVIAENLKRMGRTAGLTNEELDACFSDGDKAQTLVAWYQEHAEADGISGTPSFVIDGKLHSNMGYDEFAALFDEKLAAQ